MLKRCGIAVRWREVVSQQALSCRGWGSRTFSIVFGSMQYTGCGRRGMLGVGALIAQHFVLHAQECLLSRRSVDARWFLIGFNVLFRRGCLHQHSIHQANCFEYLKLSGNNVKRIVLILIHIKTFLIFTYIFLSFPFTPPKNADW